MDLNGLSLTGWIHTLICVLAMLAGTLQMMGRKGTVMHVRCGDVYFLSMLIANTTALFIFHGADVIFSSGAAPLRGGIGFFHWLAVAALTLVLLGRLAASRQRQAFIAYAHPICMILRILPTWQQLAFHCHSVR
jgi:uncharacterized membrane protein